MIRDEMNMNHHAQRVTVNTFKQRGYHALHGTAVGAVDIPEALGCAVYRGGRGCFSWSCSVRIPLPTE
jgi:hypothetical protein